MNITKHPNPRRYINRNRREDALDVCLTPTAIERAISCMCGKFGAAYVRVLEALPLQYVHPDTLFKMDMAGYDLLQTPPDLPPNRHATLVNRARRVASRVNRYLVEAGHIPF